MSDFLIIIFTVNVLVLEIELENLHYADADYILMFSPAPRGEVCTYVRG